MDLHNEDLAEWVDRNLPRLAEVGYEVTSEATETYNCIAYAAGDEDNWWEFWGGYPWPSPLRSPLIEALEDVFIKLGFEHCDDAAEEPGYHKVALYALGPNYTHAAKQLPGGKWSSKLGDLEDIQHESPDSLAGGVYGEVYCIMRRSNNASSFG